MTNSERAAIALWSKKNGTMPRGNNNYGQDIDAKHERGIKTLGLSDGRTGRIATGSASSAWSHDGTSDGIYDLNGNITEWISGLRLVNGEINIIPYNNAALTGSNHNENSKMWKSISENGEFVEPGSKDTLKYIENSSFDKLKINTDLTPEILVSLALMPGKENHGNDYFTMTKKGETTARFGGYWGSGSFAGIFCIALDSKRNLSNIYSGFRSSYIS